MGDGEPAIVGRRWPRNMRPAGPSGLGSPTRRCIPHLHLQRFGYVPASGPRARVSESRASAGSGASSRDMAGSRARGRVPVVTVRCAATADVLNLVGPHIEADTGRPVPPLEM